MLTLRAMASAVSGWSPVTIVTLIPASRHETTASATPSRGGSTIEMRPQKVRPEVGGAPSSVAYASADVAPTSR